MAKKQIADMIRQIANPEDIRILPCNVTDVADRTCTCQPINGDAELKDVRLNVAGTGIIIKPTVNKPVLVIMITPVDSFIALYSDIDSIIIDGGANNGLVKVDEMVSWMQKVHADLLTLQTSLASHLVAGNGAPLALLFNPTTPAPVSANMQNAKIKH